MTSLVLASAGSVGEGREQNSDNRAERSAWRKNGGVEILKAGILGG